MSNKQNNYMFIIKGKVFSEYMKLFEISFKYCSLSQEPLGELLLYERTFHHRDTDMLQRAAQSLTSD